MYENVQDRSRYSIPTGKVNSKVQSFAHREREKSLRENRRENASVGPRSPMFPMRIISVGAKSH